MFWRGSPGTNCPDNQPSLLCPSWQSLPSPPPPPASGSAGRVQSTNHTPGNPVTSLITNRSAGPTGVNGVAALG